MQPPSTAEERREQWMRVSGAQKLADRSTTSYAEYVAASIEARFDTVRREVWRLARLRSVSAA
jgi:hypothetical protein